MIDSERGREPWLFNLEKDPVELKNLIYTKEGENIVPELQELLDQLKK